MSGPKVYFYNRITHITSITSSTAELSDVHHKSCQLCTIGIRRMQLKAD